jgi:hypothetical protein
MRSAIRIGQKCLTTANSLLITTIKAVKSFVAGPGSEKPRVYYREVIQKPFVIILELINNKDC